MARYQELTTADLVVLWSNKGDIDAVALGEACCAADAGVPYAVGGHPIYLGNDMYESRFGAVLMRATLLIAGQATPADAGRIN